MSNLTKKDLTLVKQLTLMFSQIENQIYATSPRLWRVRERLSLLAFEVHIRAKGESLQRFGLNCTTKPNRVCRVMHSAYSNCPWNMITFLLSTIYRR